MTQSIENQKVAKNIIAAGQSSIKLHVWNGSRTLCNRRSLMTETKSRFIEALNSHPEICCSACAKKIK